MKRIQIENTQSIKSTITEMQLEKKLEGLTPRTVSGYGETIKYFLKSVNIDINDDVSAINKQAYQKWADMLIESKLSPASVNHYLRCLRMYVNWLSSNDYIEHFQVSLIKCQQEKLDIYTEDDVRILMAPRKFKRFSEYRSYVAIAFIISTGARASTIINMKWADINFEERTINFTHTKNKKQLSVPLSDGLAEILYKYRRIFKEENEYLFINEFGNQLTVKLLNQSINRYCELCGVKPRGVHAFRHFFAKAYLQNGGTAFHLQKMLGHSDISMTQKYVHLFINDLLDDFDNLCPLDNIFKK